jgi:ribosomal protein S12 methylthiotransferase accessory factor
MTFSMLKTDNIGTLLQPCGGLFSSTAQFRAQGDEPQLATRFVKLGNVGVARRQARSQLDLSGTGVGLEDRESAPRAFGEALERYCTAMFSDAQFTHAAASELAQDALDLDTIPCCDRSELDHPCCPLVAPDKKQPIRWVQGLSLLDGRSIFIPAVMAYLDAGFITSAERFWLPITTGCAAHGTFERAVVSAILEVIERDAIAITWLQKLRLRRIHIDHCSGILQDYWSRYERSSRDLEYLFLDATTDLGIPTIYGLQIARANHRLRTLVSCATALAPAEAVVAVMREMSAIRTAFRRIPAIPASWDNFGDVFHGAIYMADAQRANAFDFLTESDSEVRLSEMPKLSGVDDAHDLRGIVELLRARGLQAYAVDLSSDEALRCGMRVVRVIIPALQPLSFHYRARYLGTPRLYQLPARLGHPVYKGEQLNYWPQPFA